MSGDNPFICDNGGYPIQSTVSRVEQSLSIFEGALYFIPQPGGTQEVSFDYDECCAFQAVLAGLRGALRDAVNKLDDYQPKPKDNAE